MSTSNIQGKVEQAQRILDEVRDESTIVGRDGGFMSLPIQLFEELVGLATIGKVSLEKRRREAERETLP